MRKNRFIGRLLVLASLSVGMLPLAHATTWLDPKDIRTDLKPIRATDSNISEAEFRQIIDKIQSVYSPIVSRFGGRLSINSNWSDDTPNAGADQMLGQWKIMLTGGLARQPAMTHDAYTLVICHEMGHHLGGFAFAPAQLPFLPTWAADEGQADYFSTFVCAKKLWQADEAKNAEFRASASAQVKTKCDAVWSHITEQDLCYRTLAAVQALTTVMADLMKVPVPNLDTPDPKEVSQTSHEHPAAQCRMDTTSQAALCLARFNENLIPGKSYVSDSNTQRAEREASQVSCTHFSGFEIGLRPRCWFKPNL